MNILNGLGQAALAGGCVFLGAGAIDFFGRKIIWILDLQEAADSLPMKDRSSMVVVAHKINGAALSVEKQIIRQPLDKEVRPGAVLGGGCFATLLCLSGFGVDSGISHYAIGMTSLMSIHEVGSLFKKHIAVDSRLMSLYEVGSLFKRSIACGSSWMDGIGHSVYGNIRGLIDKEVFNKVIKDCMNMLKGVKVNRLPLAASPIKDLNAAEKITENQLRILTDRLSIDLTLDLLYSQVLGGECCQSVREGVQKEASKAEKDKVPFELEASYLKHAEKDLSLYKKLLARVWFSFSQGFISSLVEKFSSKVLIELRRDFVSEDGANQRDLALKVMAKLKELFELKATSGVLVSNLEQECRALGNVLFDHCMPKLEYFAGYYEIPVIGTFFKVLDQVVIFMLNYFFGMEESLKKSSKEAISKELFKRLNKILEPENMKPILISYLTTIEELVNTPSPLVKPLSDAPGFNEVKDVLKDSLEAICAWLDIKKTLPPLSKLEFKEMIVDYATPQVLRAISDKGAPVEIEEYILGLLELANKEESASQAISMTDGEFEYRIKQSMSRLKRSSASMIILGDHRTSAVLCKGQLQEQFEVIEKTLSQLINIKNKRLALKNASVEDFIVSLQEESVVFKLFFNKVDSFALRIENGLSDHYQQHLRQNCFPIYENMKNQIDVLIQLQQVLEGKGLGKADNYKENHAIIRKALSQDTVKVGPVFHDNLVTAISEICRKGNVLEEDILVRLRVEKKDLDKQIEFKLEILNMIESQSRDYFKIENELKEVLGSLFTNLIKLKRNLERVVADDSNIKPKPPSVSARIFQEQIHEAGDRSLQMFLSEPNRNALSKKISDFSLTRESHTELASLLLKEITSKILLNKC